MVHLFWQLKLPKLRAHSGSRWRFRKPSQFAEVAVQNFLISTSVKKANISCGFEDVYFSHIWDDWGCNGDAKSFLRGGVENWGLDVRCSYCEPRRIRSILLLLWHLLVQWIQVEIRNKTWPKIRGPNFNRVRTWEWSKRCSGVQYLRIGIHIFWAPASCSSWDPLTQSCCPSRLLLEEKVSLLKTHRETLNKRLSEEERSRSPWTTGNRQ